MSRNERIIHYVTVAAAVVSGGLLIAALVGQLFYSMEYEACMHADSVEFQRLNCADVIK